MQKRCELLAMFICVYSISVYFCIFFCMCLVFFTERTEIAKYFTNPLGGKVIMKQRKILKEDCDIFHFWNLCQNLGILTDWVTIANFTPYFSHGQNIHLDIDMIDLATGSRRVSIF